MKQEYHVIATRVGEILHYIWDPIGVAGVAMARDEYDSYVPQVVRLLSEGKSEADIAKHLSMVEVEQMGLNFASRALEKNQSVARILIEVYQSLKPRY